MEDDRNTMAEKIATEEQAEHCEDIFNLLLLSASLSGLPLSFSSLFWDIGPLPGINS